MVKNIVDKASEFATQKHKEQKDDTGKPYILHPAQVAAILEQVTEDKNIIAAGWLHDVIEDCGVTYEELKERFGHDVADLVNEVTHEGKKDWSGYFFPRLKTQRGIMIKFADRLSNISRMEGWNEERKAHYLRRSKFWKDTGISEGYWDVRSKTKAMVSSYKEEKKYLILKAQEAIEELLKNEDDFLKKEIVLIIELIKYD